MRPTLTVGKPFDNRCHVTPLSGDLYTASNMTVAYRVEAFTGSCSTSDTQPESTPVHVAPLFVDLNRPAQLVAKLRLVEANIVVPVADPAVTRSTRRSEERRVGKECRYRRPRYQQKNTVVNSAKRLHST